MPAAIRLLGQFLLLLGREEGEQIAVVPPKSGPLLRREAQAIEALGIVEDLPEHVGQRRFLAGRKLHGREGFFDLRADCFASLLPDLHGFLQESRFALVGGKCVERPFGNSW